MTSRAEAPGGAVRRRGPGRAAATRGGDGRPVRETRRLMTSRAEVLGALSSVRDPELNEPITDLDFVSELEVEGGTALVRLRLPTYFCAPNFAYLMVADADTAVRSVPRGRRAQGVLGAHLPSPESTS